MEENVSLRVARAGEVEAEVLLLCCLEGQDPPVDGLPEAAGRAARELGRRSGWRGADQQRVETAVSPEPDGGDRAVGAVALRGLGRGECLGFHKLARAVAREIDRVRENRVSHLAVRPPAHATMRGEEGAWRLARAVSQAAYRYERYLTRRNGDGSDGEKRRLVRVTLVPPPGEEEAWERGFSAAPATAAAADFTRDLANTPPNEATPAWMEERARELARDRGMDFTVLGVEELRERGMGGILAVGAGSRQEPRLLRLEWEPPGADGSTETVALVGKGVTFDTGGISIKPAAAMDQMKYDKCGACTVLGIAHAWSALEVPKRLRVYVPLAENMPDGAAYRPGDIVRCYNGRTVEIINTDAEGRMLLADALAWADEEGADAILEYSTLTGASVVALGQKAASVYTPDDALAADLLASAEASGERLWRMPLWPEFVEQMKGDHADLVNAGGRWGGANTAAAFLSRFVGDERTRWAHMDIAGSAHVGRDGEEPTGATGYGVATTIHWASR